MQLASHSTNILRDGREVAAYMIQPINHSQVELYIK